jgi:hypothetical protein
MRPFKEGSSDASEHLTIASAQPHLVPNAKAIHTHICFAPNAKAIRIHIIAARRSQRCA